MAGWEAIAPQRQTYTPKTTRWIINLAMSVTNTMMLRILFVSGAIGAAIVGEEEGWGFLNTITWPGWVEVTVAILMLDLVVYGQHVLFHKVPFLWRVHRVHHSDVECDVTTGVRFHPIEIIISMFIKIVAITELGASPSAVLIFEVLLNATAMFNHSNVRIPSRVDRLLRWVVVTPDMHRVHHSVIAQETDRNFGFNVPWWDRLFTTYQSQPSLGHEHMTIGLEPFRDPTRLTWLILLALPFINKPAIQPATHERPDYLEQGSEEAQFEKIVKEKEEVFT